MIFAFFSFKFWFSFLLFIVGIFFLVFVPGVVFLQLIIGKNKSPQPPISLKVYLSVIFGLTLLVWVGYFLAMLGVRWGIFAYLLVCIILAVVKSKYVKKSLHQIWLTINSLDRISLGMIITGSILQLLTIFPSGFLTESGAKYVQINAHDGLFHVSVIEMLKRQWPPMQPGAVGYPLTNYHYWSDFLMSELSRVLYLSSNHMYFHFFPLLIAPLLGIGVYLVAFLWFKNKVVARWSVFFHFFAGDVSYIFVWLIHRSFGFVPVSIDNGLIQLVNMPQAIGKLLFLGGVLGLIWWFQHQSARLSLLLGMVLATLTGMKIYFAISVALGLGIVGVVKVAKSQSSDIKNWLILAITFGVLSLAIFLPANKQAGGLYLVWSTWPKLLISPEKLNWNEWWLRMQVYQEAGNTKAIFVYLALANLVFMISFYGVKLLGLLAISPEIIKKNFWMWVFGFPQVIVLGFLGMHTLQTSGGHNTFNFTILALTWLTFFASAVLVKISNFLPRTINWLAVVLIVAFTIPRVISLTLEFWSSTVDSTRSQFISTGELAALDFIKANFTKDTVIQADYRNSLNTETPYLFAFTGNFSYLGGTIILESHNQDIKLRKEQWSWKSFQQPNDQLAVALNTWGVNVLYVKKDKVSRLDSLRELQYDTSVFNRIYENDEVAVLVFANTDITNRQRYCGEKRSYVTDTFSSTH